MRNQTNTVVLLCTLFLAVNLPAQTEYIGAGNSQNVIVTSSSSTDLHPADNTINASGMDADMMEASRFLAQAAIGYDKVMIEHVAAIGMEQWIEEQQAMDPIYMTPRLEEIWDDLFGWNIEYLTKIFQEENPGEPITDEILESFEDDIFGPWALDFHYTWYEQTLTQDDLLRKKMAWALSQLMVVSSNSDLHDHAEGLTTYYDILLRNAFGNYRDLLEEVTLSSSMGLYLSHHNNPREIPEENLHPDENYAREIMQLFSIGLYELNQDGTRKTDNEGRYIPTYNNNDIKQLARVFTGLGSGGIMENPWVDEPFFGMSWYLDDNLTPMKMYEEWHETGSKTILGELELPAGQPGMVDIEMTLDFLFNHDNVGPFVSRQLIQRFVTSNPTPAYISRVAGVFADNGAGVRGDLGAVVKAILMDEEARSCDAMQDPANGKLTEPLSRFLHLGKAFPLQCYKDTLFVINGDTIRGTKCDETRVWLSGFDQQELLRQGPLDAPSVFNFYLPDHQPVGDLAQNQLVAPEFKIHDASTSINYFNRIFVAAIWDFYGSSWDGDINEDLGSLSIVTIELEEMMDDPESVINYMDMVFLRGAMTDRLRNELRLYINDQPAWVSDVQKVRGLIFLSLISPEFAILK